MEKKEFHKKVMASIGHWMERIGLLGLPLGIGALIGFYAADQEMRLVPDFFSLLVIAFSFFLLFVVLGRLFASKLYKESQQQNKVRKRVIACLIAILLLACFRLVLFWAEQPSPLTDLTPAEFNHTFAYNAQLFKELEKGLDNAVQYLNSKPEIFNAQHVLTAAEEQRLQQSWISIWDMAFALDQIRYFYEDWYRYDISRVERDYHLKSFLLTYAAELVLYEKSSRIVKLVNTNDNAVKFLNAAKKDWDLPANSFALFRASLQGERDQARVLAGKQYLDFLRLSVKGFDEATALGCDWLWKRIEKNYSDIDAMSHFTLAMMGVSSDLSVIKTTVKRNWYPAQSRVAEWMGDTRVRRIGKPLITNAQLQQMEKLLQPGDILLTRHNWYLSNIGLPGFWPHAAIYIGDKQTLEDYFDTPEIQEFITTQNGRAQTLQEYIARHAPKAWWVYAGKNNDAPLVVLEAVSEGVSLSTMNHLQADYLAALRPRLSRLDKLKAIVAAFSHFEKPYDFNFDFATDHALVCTELVWRSYRPGPAKNGLAIPLVTVMGRKTFPANNLAELFATERSLDNPQLEFIYFLDGREKEKKAVVGSEGAFISSYRRTKWDVLLE